MHSALCHPIRNLTIVAMCVLCGVQAQRGSAQVPAGVQPLPDSVQYSPADLDRMLAPVALYPDELLSDILMAATYPLDVVEADRWLQDPAHAGLAGEALGQALLPLPWDASVKSLAAFPQILRMMDQHLDWTEWVGDAFLAQQSAVMDSVQRLRHGAQANGTLASSPQQIVETQGPAIAIEPANPDVVYVPAYDPATVYGNWPYPGDPPYYFPGYAYDVGIGLAFGAGIAVLPSLWGWHRSDWPHHRIDIDGDRLGRLRPGQAPAPTGAWKFDPDHRGGVPFSAAALNRQFGRAPAMSAAPDQAPVRRSGDFRGFAPTDRVQPIAVRPAQQPRAVQSPQPARQPPPEQGVPRAQVQPAPAVVAAPRPQTQPAPAIAAPPRPQAPPAPAIAAAPPRPAVRAQPPAPPAVESYGRGAEVRAFEQRGAVSRNSAPAQGPSARPGGRR